MLWLLEAACAWIWAIDDALECSATAMRRSSCNSTMVLLSARPIDAEKGVLLVPGDNIGRRRKVIYRQGKRYATLHLRIPCRPSRSLSSWAAGNSTLRLIRPPPRAPARQLKERMIDNLGLNDMVGDLFEQQDSWCNIEASQLLQT